MGVVSLSAIVVWLVFVALLLWPRKRRRPTMKIVVHGGGAHLDDLFSCALIWGALSRSGQWPLDAAGVVIERRDPTPEELKSQAVWVADVGGVHDPEHLCFDHHQFGRGNASAMTLVADYLGIRFKVDRLFPWFETRAAVDAKGPFAIAKERGLDWEMDIFPFMGPCEEHLLAEFEKNPVETVRPMAKRVRDALVAYERLQGAIQRWNAGDVEVVDFTKADDADVEAAKQAFMPRGGVVIFNDDRGPGLALVRVADDPKVDFRRIASNPEVTFAHANGFLAKTKSKDLAEARRLVAAAAV